jgi:transcriptional regulator with XRE-family HTH domain
MSATTTYGGWVVDRPVATGDSFGLVKIVSWMVTAGAVIGSVGTGGELSLNQFQRAASRAHVAFAPSSSADIADVVQDRTPSEDLLRIRSAMAPAVSDLAVTFGVTRQSVYNWLNGDSITDENAAKLRDLAQAADVLIDAGVQVNAALLKRKFSNGKTLLQVAQHGGSAREAALLLVQIQKREAEQRERMNARLARAPKGQTTADFDLPPSNDQV